MPFPEIMKNLALACIMVSACAGLIYLVPEAGPLNFVISLLIASGLAVTYHFTIQTLCRKKRNIVLSRYVHPLSLLWLFFLVLAGITYVLCGHGMYVEFDLKPQIQQEARTNERNIADAMNLYNRVSTFNISEFETAYIDLLVQSRVGDSTARAKVTREPFNFPVSGLDYLGPSPQSALPQKANPFVTTYKNSVYATVSHFKKNQSKCANNELADVLNWRRDRIQDSYVELGRFSQAFTREINDSLAALKMPHNESAFVSRPNTGVDLRELDHLLDPLSPTTRKSSALVVLIHLLLVLPYVLISVPKAPSQKFEPIGGIRL